MMDNELVEMILLAGAVVGALAQSCAAPFLYRAIAPEGEHFAFGL